MHHYDVFFSYNSLDHEQIEPVARDLHRRGVKVFLDRWYLQPGRPWPEVLEETLRHCGAVAIFLGRHRMGNWQQRERDLALDRQVHEPHLPVIPVLLPGASSALGFLSLNTWVDLRTEAELELGLDILEGAIRGRPPGPKQRERIARTMAGICPYRGMQAFREEDAPYFFGRERFTEVLKAKVVEHNVTAVVGASGSGKSSVVRAGLIPMLRSERGNEAWEIVITVPTDRPIHQLASALLPLLEPDLTAVEQLAEIDKLTVYLEGGADQPLRTLVESVLSKQVGTKRLMLIVDQWEELYTMSLPEVARRYTDLLLQASSGKSCRLVLALRGDFFGNVLSYRPLSDRLQDAVVNLGPLAEQELKAAITEPAVRLGLEFESGLVERILADAGDEPGHLPLLEFVLKELWEHRKDGVLRHSVYDAMGKLQGAIATRAEKEYLKLDSDSREDLQDLFVNHLVHANQGREYTRRRAYRDVIPNAQWNISQEWSTPELRILVSGYDAASKREVVEVAHEAIFDNWNRLDRWLREDLEFILWRERTRVAKAQWKRTREDEGALLKGVTLAEALGWYRRRAADCEDLKRYIEESTTATDAEQERGQRRRRRLRLSYGVGAFILFLAASVAASQWLRASGAQRSTAEALEDVLRLSDIRSLELLEAWADTLWPAHPEKLDEIGLWLAEAKELAERLPPHKARLAELRESAREGTGSRDIGSSGVSSTEEEDWVFDSASDEWQHNTLEGLVNSLERLTDPDSRLGLIVNVEARQAFAASVRRVSIDEQEKAWRAAIESIADVRLSPAYGGLEITPQLGLVPIGQSPSSGLWEFAHVQTGRVASTRSASGEVLLTEGDGIVLILMPAGTFTMGNDGFDDGSGLNTFADAQPTHAVTLEPFLISKFEMTQGQWLSIAADNPSIYHPGESAVLEVTWNNPVESVTWYESVEILGRLALQLPTEAQWEYAARSGTTTRWWTGANKYLLAGAANLADESYRAHFGKAKWGGEEWLTDGYAIHAPVGSFRPNLFGLYDTAGNVYEWCLDTYDAMAYREPARAGDGYRGRDGELKVSRGGSYSNDAEKALSSMRFADPAGSRFEMQGLRPAMKLRSSDS